MQSFKFISFSVFEKIEVLNPPPPLILPRPNDPPQKTQLSTNRVWFFTVSIILPKMPVLGHLSSRKYQLYMFLIAVVASLSFLNQGT